MFVDEVKQKTFWSNETEKYGGQILSVEMGTFLISDMFSDV
jgi:hypothetical protein